MSLLTSFMQISISEVSHDSVASYCGIQKIVQREGIFRAGLFPALESSRMRETILMSDE